MKVHSIRRGERNGDAVYMAALLGGRTLWNERNGELHKYSWRQGIHDVGIVLPQSRAQDPRMEWAKDPYRLWNTAEFAENHPHAYVARHYFLALPAQMTAGQHRDLVYGFAQDLADDFGFAIDVALQSPHARAGHRVHLLDVDTQAPPSTHTGDPDRMSLHTSAAAPP